MKGREKKINEREGEDYTTCDAKTAIMSGTNEYRSIYFHFYTKGVVVD